jgi:hypothetical protein
MQLNFYLTFVSYISQTDSVSGNSSGQGYKSKVNHINYDGTMKKRKLSNGLTLLMSEPNMGDGTKSEGLFNHTFGCTKETIINPSAAAAKEVLSGMSKNQLSAVSIVWLVELV